MEPFVDFGLIEILFVLGISYVSIRLLRRTWMRVVGVFLGVASPVAVVILSADVVTKIIACVALVTALVNSYVLVVVMKNGSDVEAQLREAQSTMVRRSGRILQKILPRKRPIAGRPQVQSMVHSNINSRQNSATPLHEQI